MKFSSFKFIFENASTSSLTAASFFDEYQVNNLIDNTSQKNIFFGKSEKDLIEINIYNLDQKLVTSSYIDGDEEGSTKRFVPYTQSYTSITNEKITYSYEDFVSNFVIPETRGSPVSSSIFVDVEEVFESLGLQDGNYTVSFVPTRNVVGDNKNPKQKLIIDAVSPSRKEIALIPTSKKGAADVDSTKLNEEFEMFSNSLIKPRFIDDELFSRLSKIQFYFKYIEAAEQSPDIVNRIKFFYSFKTDLNLANFISDIYYGVLAGKYKTGGDISNRKIDSIYDQFKNTLLSNYNNAVSFQEIKDAFYSIFVFVLNKELNQITNRRPDDFEQFVQFFSDVIYEKGFLSTINEVEFNYEQVFYSYLRNSIRFPDGNMFYILNKAVSRSNDENYHDRLILKFTEPLPTNYVPGDVLWIANNTLSMPILQRVYYFSENIIFTTPIRGPNFNIKIENNSNSTANFSIDTIVDKDDKNYEELMSKLDYKINNRDILNVDYRSFENFVKFSSVSIRLNVYYQKIVRIQKIKQDILDIEQSLVAKPNDKYYIDEKKSLIKEQNEIENSFDGYEEFLNKNPEWFDNHSRVSDGLSASARYDRENFDCLYNNLPTIIRENFDNYDYIHFVNMIGHYFDNLTLYINQFTQKNKAINGDLDGISKDVVHDMLASLGWETEIGKDNIPLILSSFSKDDFEEGSDLYNQAYNLSEEDRNKFIWKRILNNLPYILKSKGTEGAIDALINCFGIPRNLLQIKEFGGIEFSTDLTNDSYYKIEEVKYSPNFSGSGEYFDLPWSTTVQTLQFDFSFDKNKVNSEGEVFRLISASGSAWAIGAVRTRGTDWGRMFFSLRDTSNNVRSFTTEVAPIFDGSVYSVALKKYLPDPFYQSTPAKVNQYPNQYELIVLRSDEERITFETSASIFLSGSFNTVFRNPQKIYAGNYLQNTSSLQIDPEVFYGTIDEIKMWSTLLDKDNIVSQAIYKGSYSLNNPNQAVETSLLRMSFEAPVDLHTTSLFVEVKNKAFKSSIGDIRAYNFPQYFIEVEGECGPEKIPFYPYQFKKIDLIQASKVPNFGSNKFRGNKVKYKSQRLAAGLSPSSKSTVDSFRNSQVDSNKLGVFVSPTGQLNEEIIKFFGGCEFGNLIGDPKDVYRKNYKKFNEFKRIFFNQGFGNLDYQTFINYVRSYFDKSLFKYIRKLVPQRASTVEGVLVEPTILERPKIQLKPLKQQTIRVDVGDINQGRDKVDAAFISQQSTDLIVRSRGISVYEDAFGSFYPDRLEPYGFSILGKDGVSFYKDDYYRVEVVKVKKSYTVLEKKPKTATITPSVLKNYIPNHQTIEKSYDQISISKFPIVKKIPGFKITTANMVFVGEIVGETAGKITNFGGGISEKFIFSGSFYNQDPGGIMTSGSGDSGLFINSNDLLGIEGVIASGSIVQVAQTLPGTDEYIFNVDGSMTASLYTPDGSQIFDYLIGNSRGRFFSNIRDSSFDYRFSISQQNKPVGSVPLDGYYLTSYIFKKPLNDRNKKITRGNLGIRTGIFKKNFQNQKTTVDSDTGLTNNTPPVETVSFVATDEDIEI
jgi:hypothetical protein